jgi:hypothetical protein
MTINRQKDVTAHLKSSTTLPALWHAKTLPDVSKRIAETRSLASRRMLPIGRNVSCTVLEPEQWSTAEKTDAGSHVQWGLYP